MLVPSKYRGTKDYEVAVTTLIEVARGSGQITYGELRDVLGWKMSGSQFQHEIAQLLGEITEDEVRLHKRPMLSATVINQEDNSPGPGFFNLARDMKMLTPGEEEYDFWLRELKRVRDYWKGAPDRGNVLWHDAVVAALHRYSGRHNTPTITRKGLLNEELAQIIRDTASEGKTPEQTLSRVLQELQEEKVLYFDSRGTYMLMDAPIRAEKDDLPDDAIDVALEANKLKFGNVETAESAAVMRVRRGQTRIRELALKYYGHRCGFCDVSDRSLLVAGHVSRWADDPDARGDMTNVICMCSFHDALFENGYMALADDYRVLRKSGVASVTVRQLLDHAAKLRSDIVRPPSPVFLKKHRIRTSFEA